MEDKHRECQEALRVFKPIRTFTGLMLVVGLVIALLGAVTGSRTVAFWGWILWAVFAFVPALLLGIEAILTKEVMARILILVGPGIRLSGIKARIYGIFLILMAVLGILVAIVLIVLFSTADFGYFAHTRQRP
jgi:hypothetical protein